MTLRIKKLYKSISYAWRGLLETYRQEQNFKIQVWVAVVVMVFGFVVRLSNKEWVIILLVISMVLLLELMNTLVEKVIDILEPKIHHYVKTIKDIMAAAVLPASINAIVIGCIIFLPYIFT